MTEREKIAGRIRGLRAKTVANGCTEEEAMSAAEKVAEMLGRYNMTVDETELRASPFQHHEENHTGLVGELLWIVATAVADLTGATYWAEKGERGKLSFFGFDHEVAVSCYLLDVCKGAMNKAALGQYEKNMLFARAVRLRRLSAFLEGMADRLNARIRVMKPVAPIGKGLVVLRASLIKAALAEKGISIKTKAPGKGAAITDDYRDGWDSGADVALNPAVHGSSTAPLRLSNQVGS